MIPYVLGLDLGSSSVGWAMIAKPGHTFENGKVILTGARVFPAGVADMDTSKEKPLGQTRRLARGQRRLHHRRRQRRYALRIILKKTGLFPENTSELQSVLKMNPYTLRAKGLDEKLSPHQIGRILYHLCQRRGFKSNRKQEKSKEDGKVAKDTKELQKTIEAEHCRTFGEYLAKIVPLDRDRNVHRDIELQRARNRYTLRAMYQHEFDTLWSAQQNYYPHMLTNGLKDKICKAIFYQRPMTWDKDQIGQCELEEGEIRAPKAHWLGQKFRMMQEINLLRVIDHQTGEERSLTSKERQILSETLGAKRELSFNEIRDKLSFYEMMTFNLEDRANRKKLKGNVVEAALQSRLLKKWYDNGPPEIREELYDALADIENEDELQTRATERWGLNQRQTKALLKISLPTGRFEVSLKAMRKMMPFLEAGHVYSEAKELAGYALTKDIDVKDLLPPIDQAVQYLTNPLVHRGLAETRKVVNTLVREYGKPAEIVIELARDMKNSRERRREIHIQNARHKEENDEVRKLLTQKLNIPNPSRKDIIKYKLWKECNKICVYTGLAIPDYKLFGDTGEIQIEHILPYSRTLDDSYMNKTLCYADENRSRKGNKSPYEAYHQTPDVYETIQQRIHCLPYAKRRKFTQKQIDLDDFVQRQLNDTRYMSRLAVQYLSILGCGVRCAKGGTTSELRHQWGLNSILNPLVPDQKLRNDHRHHAIDAAVIAFTTRSALQKLSTVKYSLQQVVLDPPWKNFRTDLAQAVSDIKVSFRSHRKLAGKLHEDTAYGPGSEKGYAVVRVPVAELTLNMVKEIRDPVIQKIIRKALESACRSNDIKLGGSDKLGRVLGDTVLTMPSGVPIRKVRIQRAEKTLIPITVDKAGRPTKLVKPGGNHHVEIYEKPDGTWTGRTVSRFEAHQRLRRKQPVVKRQLEDGSRLCMWLCINDMVLLSHSKTGARQLYRVQKMSVVNERLDMFFRLHTAARIDDATTMDRITSWGTMKQIRLQKVTVDPLGRIHPCND